eukprot:UN00081
MIFLVFSILHKISIWTPISKFEFPLEICSKKLQSEYMKILSNITHNQDRLEVHLLTSSRVLNQLNSFLWPSSLMASWASHSVSSASR